MHVAPIECYGTRQLISYVSAAPLSRTIGGRLVLAGVTDLSASHSAHPAPDLAAALKGAPKDAAVILLDHQPREARRVAALGVALQLSGHTHGGMVLGLDRLAARANSGGQPERLQRWLKFSLSVPLIISTEIAKVDLCSFDIARVGSQLELARNRPSHRPLIICYEARQRTDPAITDEVPNLS